jgi:SAM-dependent methyltransferase
MISRHQISQALHDPKKGVRFAILRARELAATPISARCLVCGSRRTRLRLVERKNRTYEIRICQRCQYVSNAGNTVDYTKFASVERFRLTPRVGTAERPGREFHMARMGVDILQRSSLDVMVFGAGRSLDYRHIAQLPRVRSVVMSDVVDLGIDADFINITKGTNRRFDLIIACEVIEHFPDPVTEFPRLFKLLTRNGLLVCSTNIYDGKNVAHHTYLYGRGHVSYYSPKAIRLIARTSRMRYDFRVPAIVTGTAGPRKRYVLFSRSGKVMQLIAEYFGNHTYAPSEDVSRTD